MGKVLIFGANRGIGFSLANKYTQEGWEVTTANRSEGSTLSSINSQDFYNIDVTNENNLKGLYSQLEGQKFDLIIHNAGIWMDDDIFGESQDFSDFTRVFEVNSTAVLKVIRYFRDSIKPGGKFAMMSSRMGSIADNTSGGRYGYRMSKAALNAAGKSLSIDLAGNEIAVAVLHPGYVKTDMTGHNGLITPDESAEGIYAVLDNLSLENSGKFCHSNGENLPW